MKVKIFFEYKAMPFANTWNDEAEKYGILNDDNELIMPVLIKHTKKILTFLDKVKLKTLGDTLEKRYEMAVEKMKKMNVYDSFRKDITNAMKKKKQNAEKNVNKVISQLLMKFKDPSLKNSLSKYLKKSDIESQFVRDLKKAETKKLEKFLKKYDKLDKRKPEEVNALVKKYKRDLLRIDMYWDETMPFGEEMTFTQQKKALSSLADLYKRVIKSRK